MSVPRFASISKAIQFTTAAAILFVLVASLRFLALTGLPDDHYVHLAGAQQMLRGEWPSRDFVDLGAPLTYAIPAAAQAIFGERQLTEALLMAFSFGLGAVLTLRAGVALTGSVMLGAAAVLLELFIYPRTYSYPKIVLYAAAATAFLWYSDRPSRTRLVCVAALTAFAALVRHDHGLYIGIASVAAVALSPIPSRGQARGEVRDQVRGQAPNLTPNQAWARARWLAMLAGAVLVFMLPYFIYLETAADGVVAHIQRGVAFSALEVPRQRLTVTGLSSSDAWLLAAVWIAPVMALAILAVPILRRREEAWPIARRIGPIVVLALVANAGLIRDRLDVRLPDAIVAPALLMVWLVHQAWRTPARPLGLAARIVAVALLLATLRYAAEMGRVVEQLDRANILAGLDRVPRHLVSLVRDMDRPWAGRLVPSAVAGELRPFFDYVPRCIPPDQRLLVAAWLPEIAVLSQRLFAGGQIWFMPGALTTPADHALVMRRLEPQRIPVAVFRRPAYDDLAREFPELDTYIKTRFTEVASWSLGGSDEVHLLMARTDATGTDAKTGWPCFRRPALAG
jgi:hypothetical protein